MISKIFPCLWFDGLAKDAAEFYVSLFPDSRIDRVLYSPADNPSTPAGALLEVEFTLAGQRFVALNGGPMFRINEAISLTIDCADQGEVDHYWQSLVAGGGQHIQCGWLKDRFGVAWQVIPKALPELLNASDREGAARVMQAMLQMTKIDIAALERAYAGSRAAVAI